MSGAAFDTIFALATAPGRAGVAVIRVSGPRALPSLRALSHRAAFKTRHAYLTALYDPQTDDVLDQALVLSFIAPASYTGEDVVEYHLHGGRAVIDSVINALKKQPHHRMAEPGEFTRRAFENGKIDLTAAEAVADLIDAETQAQKIQALSQMGGALESLYNDWTERLKKTLAHLEADIEFPDEDMPDGIAPEVTTATQKLITEIAEHLNDNRRGERLRDGIQIAVIGAPNAGKSSLVNALVQRDIAIVSPLAGTTRDVIEAHLDIGGFPVILSDTAGLRPDQLPPFTSPPLAGGIEGGHDAIESEGIARALKKAQEADITILLFDGTEDIPDPHTLNLIDDRALLVVNKMDDARAASNLNGALEISVKNGEGLSALLQALEEKIKAIFVASEMPSLTRQRHRAALDEALTSLTRSQTAALPELMAEDLRLATRAIGRITGRVDVEDLLDVIFKDFCIGK
jgi:tRNA modification GTPase